MTIGLLRPAAAILAAVTLASVASAQNWKQVYEARDKGLPKTAIAALKPIVADALHNRRYAEAVKAICLTIAFEGNVEGNKPEEKVTRLEAEIAQAPAEMKPMMQSILANWYWHYFQQNRWRFHQRSQTAAPPGDDLTTWDLPRILAEIDKHFTAALANARVLKATPVSQFDDLLEKGAVPDAYRPTVFDFLAYEALEFYQAGEQGAAKAEDAFEVDAESPVFGPVSDFLNWRPAGSDAASPKLKAVRLFQELLAFHQQDADKSAFLDSDLWRLAFGKNQAVGPERDERYKAALKRFADAWSGHETAARALAALAGVLKDEDDLVEARQIALRGLELFPESVGGRMCFNLVQQIEAKQVSAITTERVWNEPWPVVAVTYRNVDRAFFRAVPVDFSAFISRQRWGYNDNVNGFNWEDREKFVAELIAAKPAAAWDTALPATADYRERTEQVAVAKGLKPGFYFILASHDATFGKDNNQVSAAAVWVSDLALVVRQRLDEGVIDGFVLQALTGEPVANATVRSWSRDKQGKLAAGPETKTDANGLFRFTGDNRQLLLLAKSGDRAVASGSEVYRYRPDRPTPDSKTVFFTDRALYRPGQTIYYKGVSIRYDQNANQYAAFAGVRLTVVFNDPNGKEIARAEHTANDYGSFDGAFTAPRDRLMGRMEIRVAGRPSATWVSVEEYKRPKFQVELSRPKEAARLGTEVTVAGKALAYTGAAIGGAHVKWRVVREVRFPHWCWWGRWLLPPGRDESQNVAHGISRTGSDGAFALTFTALPDRAVPEKSEPVFTFTVHADVTDSTGETRSASQRVRAGYTALSATITADAWQAAGKPVLWTVGTASLDDEPQPAAGTVTVYALQQPERVVRAVLAGADRYDYGWFRERLGKNAEPKPDPANPDSWALGEVVAARPFKTDATGQVKLETALPVGIYRAMLETKDRFGRAVTARQTLQVVDEGRTAYPVRLAHHFAAPKWSVEPGERFIALWGTGYETGRAYVELEHNGNPLAAFWTGEGRTQQVVEQAVGEEMRGGFIIRVTYVRENRAYLEDRVVDVPWSNKRLSLKWERFVSKLEPGQKESWTAVVAGPDAKAAAAEIVATLYDASLDQYLPHVWAQGFDVFRRETGRVNTQFENRSTRFQHVLGGWPQESRVVELTYRHYPAELSANLWGYGYFGGRRRAGMRGMLGGDGEMAAYAMDADAAPTAAPAVAMPRAAKAAAREIAMGMTDRQEEGAGGGLPGEPAPAPDLGAVAARKNLNETAFFLPHLTSGEDGVVRMTFALPEALTEWKFMGFAHDRDLRAGFLADKAVTAKELMVEPNPPRFVREGDAIAFTVKVSNQSAARQRGKVRLTFADARTLKDVTRDLGLKTTELDFDLPSKESESFSWRITIPDGMDFLTYKAVGATDRLSDGEEGFLPVLSRRILVTESLPLPIRGAQTKIFAFDRLLHSGASKTLKSESLTVQMVSQPAWYAVMALPYLMEYPFECSEQVFNRLYANDLARFIAASDPKIRRIFDLWKNTPAIDSPLEKNGEVKAVMLEETPWLRQAQDESQARRNVGILFDANRLESERAATFAKLEQMQLDDGLWPWFPGFRGDEVTTLTIATGFGRLRHLGVKDVDLSLALKSLDALDGWMDRRYREILRAGNKEKNHLSHTVAFYLYGRSFFLKDKPVEKEHREALEYWMGQAKQYWLDLDARLSQGHLAIGLKRFGDAQTPLAIMRSIRERSVSNEEMGLFWRELELSWWWYRAPIETQALMIEAFDEVEADAEAVEACKVWLLKQKQTQDWKTTKATADAVYGLLLRGKNLLASDALVEVSLGGATITREKVEAGTGFYEQRFVRGEITPAMGKVTVTKRDEGVSWGSVHWQYLEDMAKVTPYEGTPLKLKKTLYRKEATKKGQVLEPVSGPLAVGDEVVCRIELRVDRDMEYVHLKDQRGSGTEPVNVLSQTKYQDGLLYYESTRDTASHFFIHYLPKGVYVFEYSVRVQLKGAYQSGIASIQCMYAPEFNSHSASVAIEVK